jgi:cytochrome oxidase Cu insertion factor (SCO1/SenC/PrrC family)
MNKKGLLAFLAPAVIGIIFLSGCLQQSPPEEAPAPHGEGTKSVAAWMDIELVDAATGDKFKISDFKGKPVLLESFAVWCPVCLKQQKIIKELRLREGTIVHVSLDTDPNEDEARVREHVKTYGFDWYFAVSPIELTNALIDDFGLGVINAPSSPMVLICEDQSARFLRSGVKSADELLSEVNKGC